MKLNAAPKYLKMYIFRGLLAIIPIGLSYFVVQLLYTGIDQRVMGWVDDYLGFRVPGLGIVLVLFVLYLLGLLTSNIIGKRFFAWVERIVRKIPIVKTTYQVGKQLSDTLSLPEKQVFKRAVLVEYLKPGMWTVGFVTGTMVDQQNSGVKLLKIYVPTPPNPTSGWIVLAKESDIRDPGWSIEEALRLIISGGIIGPPELR